MSSNTFVGSVFLFGGLVLACWSYRSYKQRAVGWAVIEGLKAAAMFFLALLAFFGV